MTDRNPEEQADLEGMPEEVQDFPTGKDIETAEEAAMVPRDHSVAAGSDPAYPVTAAEQQHPEPVGARHARENPETEPGEQESAPQLVDDENASTGGPASAPEETAMHVEEP